MSTLKGISESRLLNTSQFAYLNWELLTYFIKKSDFVKSVVKQEHGLGHVIMFQMKLYYSPIKVKCKMSIFEKPTLT